MPHTTPPSNHITETKCICLTIMVHGRGLILWSRISLHRAPLTIDPCFQANSPFPFPSTTLSPLLIAICDLLYSMTCWRGYLDNDNDDEKPSVRYIHIGLVGRARDGYSCYDFFLTHTRLRPPNNFFAPWCEMLQDILKTYGTHRRY